MNIGLTMLVGVQYRVAVERRPLGLILEQAHGVDKLRLCISTAPGIDSSGQSPYRTLHLRWSRPW